MVRDPRGVKVLAVCHPEGCRSYVVVDPTSREACVVDPLLDRLPEILRRLSGEGARLRWIVDTHSHADHVSGAAALRRRTGADVVMHPAASCEGVTVRPADGDILQLGEAGLRVHHAPGNTPDALVLEAEGALFTGDTLLIGTVGLRDVPGADAETWFRTLRRIFDDLPESTVMHPGHDDMGRTTTTLRQERAGNGWLREDDLEAFRARYDADDRPVRGNATEILAGNRSGLERMPRDLEEATGGLIDPAHATEAALNRTHVWETDVPTVAPLTGSLVGMLFVGGIVVLLATLLGWLVHPLAHALAGLAGAVMIGAALKASSPRRRRPSSEPSLFYEGPTRRTIGD